MKTLKNKLYSLGMTAVGVLTCMIGPEHDATALVVILMFSVPLFFAKENWII